jgi:large subunit ribosomal protein L25
MNLKATNGRPWVTGLREYCGGTAKSPLSLYGPKTEPIKLTIDKLELEPIFKSGAVAQKLLKLEIEGSMGNAT